MTTVMVAVAALAPYLITIPQSNLNLITQAQTTLWNGWLVILGFYFSSSISSGKKDAAIQTLAQTAKTAQETLSASTVGQNPTATIAPGETATIKAEGDKES